MTTDQRECSDCGQVHLRCAGHKKNVTPLTPCGKHALRGATVCTSHGGGAPQVRAAAARRLARQHAEGEVGVLLESLGLDPSQVSYADVLAEQVTVAAGMAAVLKLEVGKLNLGSLYGPDHLGDARPHVLVSMLREWTGEAARLAKMAIDAGVDERRIRLAEGRGEQLAAVLSSFVGWLIERIVELGFDERSAAVLRRDEVPDALRKAITTTLAGEEDAA